MESEDLLNKGLDSEFKAIEFYLRNLEQLNYEHNRAAVDDLILDSLKHATYIVKELLILRKKQGGPLSPVIVSEAAREETGMAEIYKYELKATHDKKIQALMKRLIKEEEHHQRLVASLR